MTDYKQASFVAGELEPEAIERGDLRVYDHALALQRNLLNMPHGGLKFRGGLARIGQLRRQLTDIATDAGMFTAPNGGAAADLADSAVLFSSGAALTADSENVIWTLDFGAAQDVSVIDLTDYFLGDPATASASGGGGGGGSSGTIPDDIERDFELPRTRDEAEVP